MLFCKKEKKKKKCSLILISSKYSSVRLVSYLLSLEDCFSTDIGFHMDTNCPRGPRVRVRMVVGFTTTNAISAYHHYFWEFKAMCT
jgi:hypothetical protein